MTPPAKKTKSVSAKKEPTPEVTPEVAAEELEIYRSHLRGLNTSTLAAVYKRSATEIGEVIKRLSAEARQLQEKHGDVIETWLERQEASIDELAAVAAKEKGSARVSAIKARADLEKQKVETMRELGLLPGGAGKALSSDDLNRMAQEEDE